MGRHTSRRPAVEPACSPELAAKVSNDVNEGIDAGETRAQLRQVLHWWSRQACEAHAWRNLAETDLVTAQLAIRLLLPMVARRRDPVVRFARKVAKVVLARERPPIRC